MRIEWLHKNNKDSVILFFHGWGMDSRMMSHLPRQSDVVVCSDYRNIEQTDFPALEEYREINVVAWSMGVWAAANVLPRLNIRPSRLIGLNGTELPVDDERGIPVRIYELTEKGMNEKGREKFMLRMFDRREDWERFRGNEPERPLAEVCEELSLIRKQCQWAQNTLKWDRIYISEKDVIFPVGNQRNYWEGRCSDIRKLPGGHYPFYQFGSWEDMLVK